MRAFSILATITAFALSVNAASYNKRAISENVQSCISGINTIDSKVLEFNIALNNFTRADEFIGGARLHTAEQAIESLYNTTNIACCATTTTVSDEEAMGLLDAFGKITPDITNTFGGFIIKKPEFSAVPVLRVVYKSNTQTLSVVVKKLDSCLIAVTPEPLQARAQAYAATIDAKIVEAFAVYNITS
ncbi:uncharacterized protein EV154DRAFT_549838 [Mucor mucedo]|uniref:uncharacterized protein n=1 Tax=Mucor mucedo TaxID=29922 RepID=UPI00221F4E6E|nr:uncharacterized protein EV154DRAFT_549838 [Mucor mucedo]KAI7893506.1 hypothetical protein EV154DRAFT_549838 [Mucor mucedo]